VIINISGKETPGAQKIAGKEKKNPDIIMQESPLGVALWLFFFFLFVGPGI
jgi:hypothetical protein